MDSSEYIEMQIKRQMAKVLEEFEARVENPLRVGASSASVMAEIPGLKRFVRKSFQKLGADCTRVADPNIAINAYEPVRSST